MQRIEEETKIDPIIKILFPKTFNTKQIQSDSIANNILTDMIQFAKNYKQKASHVYIDEQDWQSIQSLCNKIHCFKTIFYCQFGCVITLTKNQPFQMTKVKLLFAKQYDFHSFIDNQQIYYIPNNPVSYGILQVGLLNQTNQSFIRQKQILSTIINQKIQQSQSKKNNQQKDRKNHHTPTWLLEVAKLSINSFNSGEYLQQQKNNKNKNNKDNQIRSKGGTLDVGQHTGITKPNTTLQGVIAFLQYVIQNKEQVNLFLFIYKLQNFIQMIEKRSYFIRFQSQSYLKCINQLIFQTKQLINKQIQFKQKLVRKKLLQLKQKIINSIPQKKNEIIEYSQLYQNIKKQNNCQFYFNSLIKYDNNTTSEFIVNGNLGQSYALRNIIYSFSNLLTYENIYPQQIWILLVEKFFFTVAIKSLKGTSFINIKQVNTSSTNNSIIHNVVLKYQAIVFKSQQNIKKYGFLLKNQSYSHYYLIKYIAAAVAFQTVRLQRKTKLSNLQLYKIPQDIQNLYQNFSSLSYDARQAMEQLLNYSKQHKNKKPIFVLDGSNSSFLDYSRIVASEDYNIKSWIKNSKNELLKKVKILEKVFQQYGKRYKQKLIQKKKIEGQKCSCTHSDYYPYHLIKCSRCYKLENVNSQISQIQKQKSNQICSDYAKNDIQLYGFLNSIPSDILGLMKIIYQSQFISKNNSKLKNNFFQINYDQLVPYTPSFKINQINLLDNYQKPAQKFIKYPSQQTFNYYKTNALTQSIEIGKLQPEKIKKLIQNYQYMIDSPNYSNSKREHQIYSKLNLKQKHQKINDYISYGSIRTSVSTQLMILGEKIKSRLVYLNTLIDGSFADNNYQKYNKILIILNSIADFKAFKILNSQSRLQVYSLVKQSLQDLLENYIKKWEFRDIYFLHIIGIIFSLFCKQLNKPQYTYLIAERAFQQYKKFAKQNISGGNQTKSTLAYFIHGILTCFSQNITMNKNKKYIHLWTKLQISFRLNKIFSDQNKNDKQFNRTITFYQFFRKKSIFENIQDAKQYFQKNLNQLTQIINQIDQDISPNSKWLYNNKKGYYIFQAQSDKNIYQINLLTGIVLKNGKQLAGLPEKIKRNKDYVQIFGQNRDLEVFQQTDKFLRTRNDFITTFPNQTNLKVFFQFKLLNQSHLLIRKIFKKQNNQQRYILIPEQILIDSNFIIPKIYVKQFYAWFSQKQQTIIFRKKQLERMKSIGLIILTKRNDFDNEKSYINEGRIIQKNFQKQPVQYLRNTDISEIFQHIKFFKKKENNNNEQKYFNLGYKILSEIQYQDYIIELDSPFIQNGQNKRKEKFWLHRYNLKFSLTEKGLLSDNYQGYRICNTYKDDQCLPWGRYDKVNCLILEKNNVHLKFAKNHNKIVLIPYTQILTQNIKNPIPQGQLTEMKMFNYQIHDHLKDLRGKNRLQQLHLAALIASCYLPNFQPLKVSNIEYSINLLRSCINTIPLEINQQKKLQSIFRNAIAFKQECIILLCQIIYSITSFLRNILPFPSSIQIFNLSIKKQYKEETIFEQKKDIIQNCKFIYRLRNQKDDLSFKQRLFEQQLSILGMNDIKSLNLNYKTKKQSKFRKKQMKFSLKQNQIQSFLRVNQFFDKFQKFKSSIVNKQLNIIEEQINFDYNLELQIQCQMSKQQKFQLQQSLKSHHIYKKKLQNINLVNVQFKKSISLLNKFNTQIVELKKYILNQIVNFQKKYQENYDFLQGKFQYFVPRDITELLCDQQKIKMKYNISDTFDISIIKTLLINWVKLSIAQNSIERIKLILSEKQLDKVALLRQLQSPRLQIQKKLYWLCFQLQMKTQIWLSQFQTYKLLMQKGNRTVTQLNMGQGKTQVIIPMIVLNQIYGLKNQRIPRVQILSPLYQQAQNNYFKFLSITSFKIHLIPLYFNRNVQINSININKIQNIFNLLRFRSLVLIDRDSSLSIILKQKQLLFSQHKQILNNFYKIQGKNINNKDKWFFRNIPLLDIFDEVDALMTCKKSFVYSIGTSQSLPQSFLRFQFARIIFQIIVKEFFGTQLCSQICVLQQKYQTAERQIKEGKFPKGFRLLSNLNSLKIKQFRIMVAENFLSKKYIRPQFQFYKDLTQKQRKNLIQYMIDSSIEVNNLIEIQKIPTQFYNQIFLLRGILGYGVLQHCLILRNGVDYGVPGRQHPKRIGVPYQAADVPSKRSQYSHPEVATNLSYLSYFKKGLQLNQFKQTLLNLQSQSQSCQNYNFKNWLNCIQQASLRPQNIYQFKQLNIKSQFQVKQIYKYLKYNRATIIYWLVFCVFPTDLSQYIYSLTASAWDLANSNNSLGFSGTKDTHWLFPQYLKVQESQNYQINGTDGKMIDLILQNTIDVIQIKQSKEDLWKRLIQTSLQLQDGCIIDAGAILASVNLQDQIIPQLAKNPKFNKNIYKGVTYCDQKGQWKVYNIVALTKTDRDTNIPEQQTFVVFDQARTRGADIKMKHDMIASLTLGPNMTKDKFMQAAGRLRKFGRNQKIHILSTSQNLKTIKGFNKQENPKIKIKKVLQWVCQNSIKQNKKMLYPNSKLAWIHFKNILFPTDLCHQQFKPKLKDMYQKDIRFETVSNLNKQIAQIYLQKINTKFQIMDNFINKIDKYGKQYKVKSQNFEDICQRQVQIIQQTQKQTQKQFASLNPFSEDNQIRRHYYSAYSLNYSFDLKLSFSSNFINNTQFKMLKMKNENFDEKNNELCQINFVYIKKGQMIIITQRQAHLKISQGIQNLGPQKLTKLPINAMKNQYIARFNDLNINQSIIKQNGLERALCQAQFFNGQQTFQNKQILFESLYQNYKRNMNKVNNVRQYVCYFLERRRCVQQKYLFSDLEDIKKQIINKKSIKSSN